MALRSFSNNGEESRNRGRGGYWTTGRGTRCRQLGLLRRREMKTFELPEPIDDGLFTPPVGPWSRDKHHFLRRYLDAFTNSMKGKPRSEERRVGKECRSRWS